MRSRHIKRNKGYILTNWLNFYYLSKIKFCRKNAWQRHIGFNSCSHCLCLRKMLEMQESTVHKASLELHSRDEEIYFKWSKKKQKSNVETNHLKSLPNLLLAIQKKECKHRVWTRERLEQTLYHRIKLVCHLTLSLRDNRRVYHGRRYIESTFEIFLSVMEWMAQL